MIEASFIICKLCGIGNADPADPSPMSAQFNTTGSVRPGFAVPRLPAIESLSCPMHGPKLAAGKYCGDEFPKLKHNLTVGFHTFLTLQDSKASQKPEWFSKASRHDVVALWTLPVPLLKPAAHAGVGKAPQLRRGLCRHKATPPSLGRRFREEVGPGTLQHLQQHNPQAPPKT